MADLGIDPEEERPHDRTVYERIDARIEELDAMAPSDVARLGVSIIAANEVNGYEEDPLLAVAYFGLASFKQLRSDRPR
jgi:hypothetical protein